MGACAGWWVCVWGRCAIAFEAGMACAWWSVGYHSSKSCCLVFLSHTQGDAKSFSDLTLSCGIGLLERGYTVVSLLSRVGFGDCGNVISKSFFCCLKFSIHLVSLDGIEF
jgi:hypothetical protein